MNAPDPKRGNGRWWVERVDVQIGRAVLHTTQWGMLDSIYVAVHEARMNAQRATRKEYSDSNYNERGFHEWTRCGRRGVVGSSEAFIPSTTRRPMGANRDENLPTVARERLGKNISKPESRFWTRTWTDEGSTSGCPMPFEGLRIELQNGGWGKPSTPSETGSNIILERVRPVREQEGWPVVTAKKPACGGKVARSRRFLWTHWMLRGVGCNALAFNIRCFRMIHLSLGWIWNSFDTDIVVDADAQAGAEQHRDSVKCWLGNVITNTIGIEVGCLGWESYFYLFNTTYSTPRKCKQHILLWRQWTPRHSGYF